MKFLRIGFGYDSHRFLTEEEMRGAEETPTDVIDPTKKLILGGETLPGYSPFKARSDGDVVFHAAVNAILSALSLPEAKDIGTLFPNTDAANSNRDSEEFLTAVRNLVSRHGYAITDLKLTIKGQPRANLLNVRQNLAKILEINEDAVLIQGTSGEEMDGAGKGLGVEVYGICSLFHNEEFQKLISK